MMQLSSKNDGSSLFYDVIITHQNFKNWLILVIFRAISIIRTELFRDVFSFIINQFDPCNRREPLTGIKFPLAAQRNQAKRACMIKFTNKATSYTYI